MPGLDIRKNDEVEVIAGKDKGKRGRVVRVLPRENRVMVEGVNRVKRHMRVRPSRQSGRIQEGGIVTKELPVHVSNVLPVCKSCGRPTRVGHRVEEGRKVRVCRRCGGEF